MGLLDLFRKLPTEQVVEKLLGTYFDSPAGRRMVEENEVAMVSRRGEAIAKVSAAEAELARAWPKLVKDSEAADVKYKAAFAALKAADMARLNAKRAVNHATAVRDIAKDAAMKILVHESPNERIDGFLTWVESECTALRSKPINVLSGWIKSNWFMGNLEPASTTNEKAIKARIAALANIRACGESLRLIASPAELEARIAELRVSLPSADQWDDEALAATLTANPRTAPLPEPMPV